MLSELMSVEYIYSKEACFLVQRLLNTTQYISNFIRASHLKTQFKETAQIATEMWMSHHPMVNSTHVGENNNAALINNWWIFSEHTDEHGATHHSANSSLYIRAILLMLMLFLAVCITFIWLCKGPIFEGIRKLCKGINTSQDQQA